MNNKQLEIITRDYKFKIENLENKSDRTLLFGKSNFLIYYHLYLKDEMFYFTMYTNIKNDYSSSNLKSVKCRDEIAFPILIKTIFYPECCDYEFCNLLKSNGIKLLFKEIDNNRPTKLYYGFLYEELIRSHLG